MAFLNDCQSFGVFPKFVCFPLPNVDNQDTYAFRKRLLRTAIIKRWKEQRKISCDLTEKTDELKSILNPLDWFIVNKTLKKNVDRRINQVLLTHRKKLKNLTRNKALPFTHKETVTNLSSHKFKDEELEILKNGLSFSIKSPWLNSSDNSSTLESVHQSMKEKLQNLEDHIHLKNELAHMAQSYISSSRPTPSDVKKYRILKYRIEIMGFHERNWLHNNLGTKPLFYRRYVDDIFCIFNNEDDATLFFDYLNSRHRNIKFTFEKEENGKQPFLDVLLSKSSDTYRGGSGGVQEVLKHWSEFPKINLCEKFMTTSSVRSSVPLSVSSRC